MKRHPVLPRLDRRRPDHRGFSCKRLRLPHDETLNFAQPRTLKIFAPIEPRSLRTKVRLRPLIVRLVNVLAVGQAPVHLGDRMLQLDNASSPCLGFGESRQLEHVRHMRFVLLPRFPHLLAVAQVILAIRHVQPTLQKIRNVAIWVVEPWSHPQPKQIRRVIVRVIQSVHVGTQSFAQSPRQFPLVMNSCDRVEMRTQRCQPCRLDSRFVHIRVVEVRDLALLRSCRRIRFRDLRHQIRCALIGQIGEFRPHVHRAAIRRNLGALHPIAVGVLKEIIARLD